MGREAVCTCDWAGTVAEVKALLETSELILRGEIRRRVPFHEIKDVRVLSDRPGARRWNLCLGPPWLRSGLRRLPARLCRWLESLALRK